MARSDPPTNANPGDDGAEVTQTEAKQGTRRGMVIYVLVGSLVLAALAGIALFSGLWTI